LIYYFQVQFRLIRRLRGSFSKKELWKDAILKKSEDTANVLAILFKGNVPRPLSTLITSFNYNFLSLLITLAARLFSGLVSLLA